MNFEHASLQKIIEHYGTILPHRPKELFSVFLAEGYRDTTLNSVGKRHEEHVVRAKMLLGMLITLLDDLADNPDYFNPKLLRILYHVGSSIKDLPLSTLSDHEQDIVDLTDALIVEIKANIKNLPHWSTLQNIFLFDIWQIYLSNRFSELITETPSIKNIVEAKFYGPYNMGMVAAGMIDLMAVPSLNVAELGKCREIFLLGQRLGRIGNLLCTFTREQNEHDQTNEIAIAIEHSHESFLAYKNSLLKEHNAGIRKISRQKKLVTNFDTKKYSDGLLKLFNLHQRMMGTI